VNKTILKGRIGFDHDPSKNKHEQKLWHKKIKISGVAQQQFLWPADWQNHPYPFIDGYFDASLYPVAQWQEASRLAFGGLQTRQLEASSDADDSMLVEQVRTKILPRRGISANREEILITSGSQHAIYLLTQLLCDKHTKVVMENPGSKALRSSLALTHCQVDPQPIDEQGLIIDNNLNKAELIFVTPSHQQPTAVTMPMKRRQQLISRAKEFDQVIIEDDSECESNYLGEPRPALKSLDGERVIYVSALPKALAPGLGLGFIVAPPTVISEARRLRRLMVGNPPKSNQRTAAFFISLGHYDAFMMRIHKIFKDRWNALRDALNHYLPQSILTIPNQGGTAFWVKCPQEVAVHQLVKNAAKQGILIEPVDDYYFDLSGDAASQMEVCFRMGVTSLEEPKIREGVAKLAKLIRELSGEQFASLAESPTKPLTQQQLLQKLVGSTLICKTVYGAPCTIELRANGKMIGHAGHANEDYDTGRWWVDGDMWYRQWKEWAYAEQAGFFVTLGQSELEDDSEKSNPPGGVSHQTISWFNQVGRLVDTAIIQFASPSRPKLV
jgi:GntR family transcriptional regulator/MocR family aminotransferase